MLAAAKGLPFTSANRSPKSARLLGVQFPELTRYHRIGAYGSPRQISTPPGRLEPLHYFFSFHLWTKPVKTPPSSYSFSLSWTISARLRPVIA
jgi:hypothetical protein